MGCVKAQSDEESFFAYPVSVMFCTVGEGGAWDVDIDNNYVRIYACKYTPFSVVVRGAAVESA